MDVISEINKAVEFVKNEDYDSAEKIYLKALELNPDNPTLLSFLGFLYISTKEFQNSENIFEKAYSISNNDSILLGVALSKFMLQKYEECVPYYTELISRDNNDCRYYEKITQALSSLVSTGKSQYFNMAYKYSSIALSKFPLNKEFYVSYSIACIYSGKLEEGEKACYQALKLDNNYWKTLSQLGLIQEFLYCDEEKAQKYYKKALKNSGTKSIYYDLGVSYSKSGEYNKAIRAFKKALMSYPDNKTIILGIAHNYFKQRKFKEGYKYYIKQNDSSGAKDLINIWDGEIHKDKTIFVYPDLAYGDHIMFMRYVPYLKNKFKKVIVYAYPELIKLFSENFEGIEFVSEIPEYDYSVVLSKLPYYLKMDFSKIPLSSGYIKRKCPNNSRPKIGLCWEAGNADIRTTIHRTININEFKRIFDLDLDIYSFQVNPSSDDYLKFNMKDLGKGFKNFHDTASALQDMDIMISVDTSVANLAGAMGVKTFLLLPYYSDWRWFDNTDRTEWYDSVKIFKQTEKNVWDNEIKRIVRELTKLTSK